MMDGRIWHKEYYKYVKIIIKPGLRWNQLSIHHTLNPTITCFLHPWNENPKSMDSIQENQSNLFIQIDS